MTSTDINLQLAAEFQVQACNSGRCLRLVAELMSVCHARRCLPAIIGSGRTRARDLRGQLTHRMGNGALAIGPKLPRPSSTRPTRKFMALQRFFRNQRVR